MASKPVLTISLLASNRPDTIRRCLDSVHLLMDRIPSELVLVDTSANPDIHKILLEYTDKVYPFTWENDFAKARNVGLEHASGEWLIFLDDDEWFVDVDDIIEFFVSGEYHEYGYANHRIRNFYDKKYETFSDAWVSRLVKLEEGSCFHSKIHEYFAPIYGKAKQLNSLSYHSGYIFETEEEVEAHAERNISLLLRMIEEEPDNSRWKLQLAQEYYSKQDWESLQKFASETFQKLDDVAENEALINALMTAKSESLLFLNRYEEAKKEAQKALAHKRAEVYTKTYAKLILAEIAYRDKEFESAEKFLEEYFAAKETYGNDLVLAEKYSDHLLSDNVFDDKRGNRACSLRILVDLKRGRTDAFHKYYGGLKWGNVAIYIHRDSVVDLIDCFSKLPYDEMFSRAIGDLFLNKYGRAKAFIEIVKHDGNAEQNDRLMYILSRAKGNDWYIQYAKILVYGREQQKEAVEEAASVLYEEIPNVLLVPDDAIHIFESLGMSQVPYWVKTPFNKWQAHVDEFCTKSSKNEKDNVLQLFKKDGMESDIRAAYFLLKSNVNQEALKEFYSDYYHQNVLEYGSFVLPDGVKDIFPDEYENVEDGEIKRFREELRDLQKEARSATQEVSISFEGMKLSEMTMKLWRFASKMLAFCEAVYSEKAFDQSLGIFPAEGRCALALYQMFQSENQSSLDILNYLKKAALEYIDLGENVKRLAHEIKNLPATTPEIQNMIEIVKSKILQMADSGLYQEALEAIRQMRELSPFDSELIAWENQLVE